MATMIAATQKHAQNGLPIPATSRGFSRSKLSIFQAEPIVLNTISRSTRGLSITQEMIDVLAALNSLRAAFTLKVIHDL